MTYLDLLRDAVHKLDKGDITLGEYDRMLEPLKQEIQPERKTGKWHFEEYPDGYYHAECSVCGHHFQEDAYLKPYNYCPNCGARMDGK